MHVAIGPLLVCNSIHQSVTVFPLFFAALLKPVNDLVPFKVPRILGEHGVTYTPNKPSLLAFAVMSIDSEQFCSDAAHLP